EAAEARSGLGADVGVAGLVEHELAEARAGAERAVLRSLERRRQLRLGERVGVELGAAVELGVVDGDPAGLEYLAEAVEVADVGRQDIGVGLAGMERDRLAGAQRDHLQRLQL